MTDSATIYGTETTVVTTTYELTYTLEAEPTTLTYVLLLHGV